MGMIAIIGVVLFALGVAGMRYCLLHESKQSGNAGDTLGYALYALVCLAVAAVGGTMALIALIVHTVRTW
jgi:hypothetical protein